MPKGVGKALKTALTVKEKKPPEKRKGETKFEFMNTNRRRIFEYLCSNPASSTSAISKNTGLSIHSVKWHLRRLIESDYVHKHTHGKKAVYFPVNLIDIHDIPIFELLNTKKAKDILLLITDKNGISQSEICDVLGMNHQAVIWYTKKLEKLELIRSLEDGKFRRYYSTELLNRKREKNAKRMKLFKSQIIKKIQEDMVKPTILRSTDDKILIRLIWGRNKVVLTIHTDPFVTVLS
jgi:predicted transcriptional regulator